MTDLLRRSKRRGLRTRKNCGLLNGVESSHWRSGRKCTLRPHSRLSPSYSTLISCANAANGSDEPKLLNAPMSTRGGNQPFAGLDR